MDAPMITMTRTVFKNPAEDLVLTCSVEPEGDALALLESARWGSDGLRYSMRDVASSVARVIGARHFLLRDAGRAVSTVLVNEKHGVGAGDLKVYYSGMLASAADASGAGKGRLAARLVATELLGATQEATLVYGFVETDHRASLRVAERAEAEELGRVSVLLSVRPSARQDAAAGPLLPWERAEMIGRLESLYDGHVLADFAQSFREADYFVLRERGEIVAGAQIQAQSWVIHQLPGAFRWAHRAIGLSPKLRRALDPDDFRFLRVENVYVVPGREAAFRRLLDFTLRKHGVATAMFFVDERSPVARSLWRAGIFGVVSRLTRSSLRVLGTFRNVGRDSIDRLKEGPVVVSPMDL